MKPILRLLSILGVSIVCSLNVVKAVNPLDRISDVGVNGFSTSTEKQAIQYYNLAVSYAETGKLNEAIALLQEARSIFKKTNEVPKYIKVSISLSLAYIEKENYSLAVKAVENAIKIAR